MKHVYWVVPEVLAGRSGPDEEPWDLDELGRAGIGCIVTLSNDAVDSGEIEAHGIAHEVMRMPEGRIRSPEAQRVFRRAARKFVTLVDTYREAGRPVLAHCLWGNDRTGIMLAAYLMMREGMTAEEAIRALRRTRPDSLRLPGYEDTVRSLEPARPKGRRSPRSSGR